jgi:two-component system CheB/CheR fusion protein
VTFTDVTRYQRLQQALSDSKREVETAYEELQSTVEELETTNEELQSTNEELETTNEELQSTNEELETMNEELQSTNEELSTINDELQQRTEELNDSNAYLEGILSSLTAAVVVVDADLGVRGWNTGARDLWGLIEDEVHGTHFLNLDIGLPVDQLRTPIRKVLAGEGQQALTLPAVNRRGRQIQCRVTVTPLDLGNGAGGAILMMEPEE